MLTGETLFRLAYGSEIIILVEVRLISYRVENHKESRNDETMHLQLDLVDKIRAMVGQRLVWYQDLMAKHYNFRVRQRNFQVGDLVLRKVTDTMRDLF